GRLRPCAGRSAWTRDTADRGWFPVENPRSSAEAVSRAQAVTREVRRGRHGPLPFRLHLDEAPDRPRSAGDVDSRRARLDDFSWLAPARIERNGAMDLQHGTGDGGPRARPGRKAAPPSSGKREACTFRQPCRGAASASAGRMRPYAATTATSGAWRCNTAASRPCFTFSGCSTAIPRSIAHRFEGGGCGLPDLPTG